MTSVLHKIVQELGVVQSEVRLIRERVEIIAQKQDKLIAQANQWKGGMILVVTLGALMSWIAEMFKYALKIFR